MSQRKLILEKKRVKVSFTKSNTKISLSKKLLKVLAVTEENPEVEIIYTPQEIIIKKN